MDIATLLAPDAIVLDASVPGQRHVLERAGALLASGTGLPAEAFVAALMERERLGTTGFGDGTAIPHGRVAGLPVMLAAIVRLSQPVDWASVDGIPVDLVVALAGPAEAGAEHLKALALISRTLRDRALVAKMRGANDAAALWALVAGQARQAA